MHPSLTYGTSGGKINIHNPYSSTSGNPNSDGDYEESSLNIKKVITSISAGRLSPSSVSTIGSKRSSSADVLFVGTLTNLMCYDVDMNCDVFYISVPDGINTCTVGKLNGAGAEGGRVAYVGGNCSIQAFDDSGKEVYWSVTGDNVNCIEFMDVDGDGEDELVVGSDDYAIRGFKDEDIV